MIIGLELRHFKAYKNKNFIPIGFEHKFISYIGENGVGKSSILQALDTFLNNKDWIFTKSQKISEAYIAPIFLIEKEKVNRLKNQFEAISNFFWSLDIKHPFTELRDNLIKKGHNKTNSYLIFLGEDFDRKLELPFGNKKSQIRSDFNLNIKHLIGDFDEKDFLKELKKLYSYIYIPIEIDIEYFTKLETVEMQKIFDTTLKDEIKTALASVKLIGNGSINTKLDTFVYEIQETLNNEYCYNTGQRRNNTVTKTDLVEKIIEVYFQKRFLYKIDQIGEKKISELSAGEKRQALINLVFAFLSRKKVRDRMLVIGIDEPENSLHTAICYEQFEKLKVISDSAQIFITTHWYGFLPVVDKGLVHFLKNDNTNIVFYHKVNLYQYPYQTKNIPNDLVLKSTNDLVQSIFYSLKANKQYSWILCEGPSDQIYLKSFLGKFLDEKNIKIISVGGVELVKKFYRYLILPISENIGDDLKGRIFCLTDTDNNLRKIDINQPDELKKVLLIKRLAIGPNHNTKLVKFEIENDQNSHGIEQSLNPIIFKKTLDLIGVHQKFTIDDTNIQNKDGNTTKENLRNFDIENYFHSEKIKNIFAEKYVKVFESQENLTDFIPPWIEEIKTFFN